MSGVIYVGALPGPEKPLLMRDMTDVQIVNVALGNMLGMLEALASEIDDEEDQAIIEYAKRVNAAVIAGDLSPIRAEIEADERAEESS